MDLGNSVFKNDIGLLAAVLSGKVRVLYSPKKTPLPVKERQRRKKRRKAAKASRRRNRV